MVVTRFAPSPTGSLHIGGIRTALYPYALAKKEKGKFILRIEDTDQDRSVPGAEQEIEDMLIAYGMKFDEKYKQSERLSLYRKYADELVENGHAYYCFATKDEVNEMRNEANLAKKSFNFRSPYRDLTRAEVDAKLAEGLPFVIRQKLPDNHTVVFDDPIQGTMSFNTNDLDETVLLKSDGFPTYHLAVVVDDHDMGVTHVFRGVEWLPSVPKHVLLYKAFGWEMPVIMHLPVILDPDGGKLSKRKGSVAAKGFLEEGYLPEAVVNFLMLLGWAAPLHYEHGEKEREIFSLAEFVELFDLKNLNKVSPVFNREKLLWFNHKYIQDLTPAQLENKFLDWMRARTEFAPELKDLKEKILAAGSDLLQKILVLEQSRIKLLSEIPAAIGFFFNHTGGLDLLATKQTKKMTTDQLQMFLRTFVDFIANWGGELADMPHSDWEEFVRKYADNNELKAGGLFMALRLAVTDSEFSPPLFEVMQILGKNETIKRIKSYLV